MFVALCQSSYHLWIQWFALRTQDIAMVIKLMYNFQDSSLSRITYHGLSFANVGLWQYRLGVVYQRSLLETPSLDRKLYWELGPWATSVIRYHDFRFLEGKQLFNINHIVCTNKLSSVSHSDQLHSDENTLQIQVLRCQLRVSLKSEPLQKQL